jgi:acyl CoA:acetate/3-ketoacid CoA transferase alpha subunit
MATAARLTVAEVRAVEDAPIAHERVQVPGVFVDRIVRVSE